MGTRSRNAQTHHDPRGLVITLNHNMNCMDRLSWTYTIQAISIAYDLQLYNPAAEVKSTKERRARDFTACFCMHV